MKGKSSLFSDLDMTKLHEFKKKQKFDLIQSLDHSKIKYRPFRKDFYDEDDQVAQMPVPMVDMLRYARHNH